MHSRNICRLLGLTALAIALAACGSSSSNPSSAAAAAQSANAGALPVPVSPAPPVTPAAPASLEFTQSAYVVAQSAGTARVAVQRAAGIGTAVTVAYATMDGTAVAGVDYSATRGTLSWAAGDAAARTIAVPISNAVGFSGDKIMQILLSSPSSGAALGTPSSTVITIQGAGAAAPAPPASAGTIAWSFGAYSASQAAGSLSVSVIRTGGSLGAVSVRYATANGTASAGSDYTATSGTLHWAAGDSASKTFTVPISNTLPFTGSRTFTIGLSGVAGGATLGANTTAIATINGGNALSVVTLGAASFSAPRSSGSLAVKVARAGTSAGTVSVRYGTADGTAKAGSDYTAVSGTLTWGAGDTAAKSFKVPVNTAATYAGSRSFVVALADATGEARLGSPNTATATIVSDGAGSISLAAPGYGIAQGGGSLIVTAARSGGATGAVSVHYATADGTAKAGTDYGAASGTLNWAAGDSALKSFSIAVSNATPYTGSRTFAVALSGAAGGAALGTPAAATVTIAGSGESSAGCAKSSGSWTTTGIFDSKNYGNYLVNNNNWGNLPGQQLWVNSKDCWGATTTSTTDIGSIRSYPSVTRGWTQNDTMMLQLSTPGTNDWTTKSGMGVAVTQLTKAKIHWAFKAPAGGTRWLGLMDIYFHQSATPSASTWPPFVDLMIDQAIADEVVNSSTYYALVASMSHATTVTLGGNQYLLYIDNAGEASYHQPAGHDIHLFQLPTAATSNNANPAWGVADAVTDLAAIVKFFMQSNPVDDAGHPLQNASGKVITSPLITPGLFLDAINAGWEIDTGTSFTNQAFCVAMQSEADCP
jgi:hypothetical protein